MQEGRAGLPDSYVMSLLEGIYLYKIDQDGGRE